MVEDLKKWYGVIEISRGSKFGKMVGVIGSTVVGGSTKEVGGQNMGEMVGVIKSGRVVKSGRGSE